MSNEQKMLNDFLNRCKPNTPLNKHCTNSRAKKFPDVCFTGIINGVNYLFSLEAKKDNSKNTWNYAKQLFGEILMNKKSLRNINKFDPNAGTTNALPKKLGLFLSYDNQTTDGIHQFLIAHINSNDWNLFGTTYQIDIIFLYDSICHKLYYTNWKDFLIYKNPTNVRVY